ncbi:Aurora/IPL1-related protein kinase 2 [Tritrichomonas foetus]|uniref:Aurora/IPL1-related protein kinase 2 n=1 Tax=Tritrichomonas foetus TaxID=1144522 RepID=A0A1J4K362_9EUKA|nr:Aurora/IPL1-related protein kinase 2 [Tritrichomonas foetus]|eukprot:OHT05410.1 Aurora/IPL1-related protein kinase 2 [Tritrichomonas foetus]
MDKFTDDETSIIQNSLSSHGYDLKEKIGRGGFGAVFVVNSRKYHEDFACKIMSLYDDNGDLSNVSDSEIEALMGLSHPNIISLYASFRDEKFLYIVFEYCPGGNLRKYIKKNGAISGQKLFSLTRFILLALNHCHNKNIAHRDIKPDNILIDKYGRPRLADFGISQIMNTCLEPIRGAGSLPYMAPETQNPAVQFDLKKADIWSLGITLYYASVGHLPWQTDNYSDMKRAVMLGMITFPPKMNSKFHKLLRRMLVVNPSKRASVEMLLDDIIFSPQHLPLEKYSSTVFVDYCHVKIDHPKINVATRRGSLNSKMVNNTLFHKSKGSKVIQSILLKETFDIKSVE